MGNSAATQSKGRRGVQDSRDGSGPYDIIPPDRFEELGIDLTDILPGTFAALNHPTHLTSRLGGDPYGLGSVELATHAQPEIAAQLEGIPLGDPGAAAEHHRQINETLKSLGLLTRFTGEGRPYYLIPHQVVARTLADIQFKLHHVAHYLRSHVTRLGKEHLDVGLIAPEGDLVISELMGRFADQHLVTLDSVEALQDPDHDLDMVIMLGDLYDFARTAARELDPGAGTSRSVLKKYVHYLLNLIYDRLLPDGELLAVLDRPPSPPGRKVKVTFKRLETLKRFVAYSHVVHKGRRYSPRSNRPLTVDRFDLEMFLLGPLTDDDFFTPHLGGSRPEDLSMARLEALPYWGLGRRVTAGPDLETLTAGFFTPLFTPIEQQLSLPEPRRQTWSAALDIEGGLPETLMVFLGAKRAPGVDVARIQETIDRRGMAGGPLPLVSPRDDTFDYVDRVIEIISEIQQGKMLDFPALELSRVRKPFEGLGRRHPLLTDVLRLVRQRRRLGRVADYLGPVPGKTGRTPVMANLHKLALYGFDERQLYQLCLMVRGHTTMTRVTWGKLSETTMSPLTDRVDELGLEEVITRLRIHRLLAVAEASAAGPLSRGQMSEMLALYDNAVRVAADPDLTWQGLVDARMSQMGGVLAESIRRMLKLFGLFDFLDNWADLADKGSHQKEVLADHDGDKLSRLASTIDLARIAHHFRDRYYPDEVPGDNYFFSSLLTGEIHGTGHALPLLGGECGFILLWIAVNTARRRPVNLNPLVLPDESAHRTRASKLRFDLAAMSAESLDPARLFALHDKLIRGGSVFVAGTGLRLTIDPVSQALNVSYIDTEADLLEIEELIRGMERLDLSRIAAPDLARLEELFTGLRVYFAAWGDGPVDEADMPAVMDVWRRDMAAIEARIRRSLGERLLEPAGLYTHVNRFHQMCPRVLEFLLAELSPPKGERGAPIKDAEPEGFDLDFALRCLRKFEALVSGRVSDFQDLRRLQLRARQELGEDWVGQVGVSMAQVRRLEAMMARVSSEPGLLKALGLGLLLQDLARREEYWSGLEGDELFFHHGLTGARVLERIRPDIVARLAPDKKTADLVVRLVATHGLFGHVFFGGACAGEFEALTEGGDEGLLLAAFLMSVINLTAYDEWLMGEDFLDRLLTLFEEAGRVMAGETDWEGLEEDHVRNRARLLAALSDYRRHKREGRTVLSFFDVFERTEPPRDEAQLAEGRRVLTLERLLRLRGLRFVDFIDLEFRSLGLPLLYIYRRKGLRSVGLKAFSKEFHEARRFYTEFRRMDAGVQVEVLDRLARRRPPIRLLSYERASQNLNHKNQIKLLLLGLRAADRLAGDAWHDDSAYGVVTINFAAVSRVIDRLFEAVNHILSGIPEDKLLDERFLDGLIGARRGLGLRYRPGGGAVAVTLVDPISIDEQLARLEATYDLDELGTYYHSSLQALKLTSHNTIYLQNRLGEAFDEHYRRLVARLVEDTRRQMRRAKTFASVSDIHLRVVDRTQELRLTKDQLLELGESLDLNLERLRHRRVATIFEKIDRIESIDFLEDYWESLKPSLAAERAYLGKNLERIIAARFDRRADELDRGGRL